MILHRFVGVKAEDWGRFVTLKGLKKPNNGTVMVFQPTSGALRSSLSTKTFVRAEEFKEHPAPQKMPRSFLFPVGEVWPPQMNFSFFGLLGCEISQDEDDPRGSKWHGE